MLHLFICWSITSCALKNDRNCSKSGLVSKQFFEITRRAMHPSLDRCTYTYANPEDDSQNDSSYLHHHQDNDNNSVLVTEKETHAHKYIQYL